MDALKLEGPEKHAAESDFQKETKKGPPLYNDLALKI
jgi:hypothetical protein